jgi:ABC-2 type transport system ATP-binding protein
MKNNLSLEVKHLNFHYPDQKNQETLRDLSLQCQMGKIHGLLGPNGSGKSTTFKIISTQLKLQKGEVFVLGNNLCQNAKKVRASMGVCFQSPSLDPLLSIEENLKIHASLYGLNHEKTKKRIAELSAIFSLQNRLKEKVQTLSGGWARRVELAKSLIHEPKLLLLDEPTTGLDPLIRRELWKELLTLRDHGISIILTTHLMDEAQMCDELTFIHKGQAVASGSPHQLQSQSENDLLRIRFKSELVESFLSFQKEIAASVLEKSASTLTLKSINTSQYIKNCLDKFGSDIESLHWEKSNLADIYFEKTGDKL